jgi:hypothetical protein
VGIGHVDHRQQGITRLFEAVMDNIGRMAHAAQYSAGTVWAG